MRHVLDFEIVLETMKRTFLLWTGLLLACQSPLDVDTDDLPLMRTVGARFALSFDAASGRATLDVPFRFANATERPLTLVHCLHPLPRFERSTPEGWVRVYNGVEPTCLELRHFAAGSVVVDTATYTWIVADPDDLAEFRSGELEGEYRLRWANLWADFHDYDPATRTWGTAVSDELLVSNTFTVVEPAR